MRATIVFCLAIFSAAAFAQTYPSRPIRLVVPFPASGATDILSRAVAQKLSDAMVQPVVVENKPGAGGTIGSDLVARSPADGYTLLMATSSTHSIGPSLQKLSYDPLRDFAPISQIADAPNILVISPVLRVNSVNELLALAKASPGKLNFSSSGTGTVTHLSGELFKRMAGVEMQHVPYKGTALAIPDMINGHIALMFDNFVSALPFVKAGSVRALAVTGAKRSPLIPDLPTVAEAGVPGYESTAYFGVLAPAGTPREILARLSRDLTTITNTPEMKERLARLGADPVGGTPEQFAEVIRAEIAKWSKVIREAGVKVE